MSVKTTLKTWIKSVDQALLKDTETPEVTRTPSFPIEDLVDQPSTLVTVSPLSTLVSPGNTVMTPIDFHDSIIAPKHVQINSPHRIEPELLAPFESGLKEVTLIFVHNKYVIQATLESVHDTHLVVRTQHSTYFRKRGEIVLILVPVLPEKRYVLQLTTEEIYAHRLMLRYQDPRYDVRRQIQLAAPLLLRLLPPMLLTAIRQQRARITRQITLPPADSLATTPGRLADQLCESDASTPSPFMQLIEQTPPLTCHLQDLSLGGLCLTLDDGPPAEELLHRLVLLHISLPLVTIDSVNHEYIPVHLDLLSAIRSVDTVAHPPTLNVRFLQRLPEELTQYLADLERRFLELQRPLS